MRLRASLLLITVWLTAMVSAQVPFSRLATADKDPANWLTYSGGYNAWRYSLLNQINAANAKGLELKWVWQARSLNPYEVTPLVVDGVMYTVQGNDVVALDAMSGKMFWISRYTPGADARPCCGGVTRGLALGDDKVFLATLDAHLIAFDAKTGRRLWNVAAANANPLDAYSYTAAPLVVKDKVIIGPGTSEAAVRGFLSAYDTNTGKEVWRFNIIPGPGEAGHETWSGDSWQHGGGGIWLTGSYDPETNLTIWGTGNPWPRAGSEQRAGDNLYTCSLIALDADTGKLKWHYQFVPHDVNDWDASEVPVLMDMQLGGRLRKVVVQANRNGFYYVLNRTTGEFLLAKAFAKQNWNAGFDAKGRPILAPGSTDADSIVYPGNQGATNWYSPSFSPRTGLYYLSAWENTARVLTMSERPVPAPESGSYGRTNFGGGPVGGGRGAGRGAQDGAGRGAQGGGGNRGAEIPQTGNLRSMTMRPPQGPNVRIPEEENYGTIRALDPKTGQMEWEYRLTDGTDAGVLATAGDVIFSGSREGYFLVLDARSGQLLYKVQVGSWIANSITYAVAGKQYVTVTAGNALFTFGLPN